MNYYEGDNIGSLLKVEAAYHTDFSGFNPLSFYTGKSWLEIPFKEQTSALFLKVADTANGLVYGYSGKFFIHHLSDEVDDTLYPYLGQISVLRLTDMNNRVYIIGSPGLPVTMETSTGTGDKYTSENGQEFSFKVDMINRALKL